MLPTLPPALAGCSATSGHSPAQVGPVTYQNPILAVTKRAVLLPGRCLASVRPYRVRSQAEVAYGSTSREHQHLPGQGEGVGVGEEMRQGDVVTRIEAGCDPHALLAGQPLRPLLHPRVTPALPQRFRRGVDRPPAESARLRSRSPSHAPRAVVGGRQLSNHSLRMQAVQAHDAGVDRRPGKERRLFATPSPDRPADPPLGHRSLSRPSCAASSPVASSPGHRLQVTSLNAARRIRMRAAGRDTAALPGLPSI